jgi:hypothetical protein
MFTSHRPPRRDTLSRGVLPATRKSALYTMPAVLCSPRSWRNRTMVKSGLVLPSLPALGGSSAPLAR